MKRNAFAGLVLALMGLLATGCHRVEEPWKSGNAYQQERSRSVAAQEMLRERAYEGMRDR